MMLNAIALLVAGATPLASALSYTLPAELMALDGCNYPANYTIQQFTTFSPASGNSKSPTVEFTFVDSGTSINTLCQYNISSNPTDPGVGLALRYPCDNSFVSFIWQNNSLTVIEAVCPDAAAPLVATTQALAFLT
jgi:hypothetical protein